MDDRETPVLSDSARPNQIAGANRTEPLPGEAFSLFGSLLRFGAPAAGPVAQLCR
jgi:hypothetical protein